MPVAVVVSPGEALRNVDCLKDGSVAEVLDPDLGPLRQAGFWSFLDSYPGVIQGPAPRVGQHPEEVLAEIALAHSNRPPKRLLLVHRRRTPPLVAQDHSRV